MTSLQRVLAFASARGFPRLRRWDAGWTLLAALAAFFAPRMPLPDMAGRGGYALFALAVAALCLRRGGYGSIRFRWGWRAAAAGAASCAVCAGIDAVSPLTGDGSLYRQWLNQIQLHGIIAAAGLLALLFLEGPAADAGRDEQDRPYFDLLFSALGFAWLFVFAGPAWMRAEHGPLVALSIQVAASAGVFALLFAAQRRGAVHEVSGAWTWLRMAVAAQALQAIFAAPPPWPPALPQVGALWALALAARQPLPVTAGTPPRRALPRTLLSVWILSAGTGLLILANLVSGVTDEYATIAAATALGCYLVLAPWYINATHRKSRGEFSALRRESVQLRNLLDNITDAVATEDLQGRIVFANRAFHRLFGVPPGRRLLQRAEALVHPDDQALRRRHLRGCLEDRRAEPRFEYRGLRSDGVTLELEAQLKPLELGGIVVGATSVIRNLARQHLIERSQRALSQRLEFFVNEMPLGCIIWDLNFAVQEWNQSAEKIFGWPRPEALHRGYFEFLACDEERASAQEFWRDLKQGHGEHFREWSNQTRDDGVIECEWFYTALLDDAGHVVAIASMVQDLTDRKDLERQLLQSQKLEAVGTLAGGIAHDFNNLLTTILGHTSLALMKLGPDHAASGGLLNAQAAAERGADLVTQLLRFGKRAPSRVEVVSLNDCVANVIRLLRPSIGSRIRIDTDLRAGLWDVKGDASQLEQALMNLLLNARDAIAGSGVILIRSRNRKPQNEKGLPSFPERPEEQVELEISDDGCGMDAETQQRIFDPFFTTKGTGRGTGLGLAMVFSIISNHAGRIEVQSQPGEGALFRIVIPRTKQAPAARQPQERPLASKQASGTILLADDEDSVRALGLSVLRDQGYTVLEAANGEEAVEVFERFQDDIDVVLLDLTMPRKSGWEAFDDIRKLKPGARVILSSGYSATGGGAKAVSRGASAFLPKPYKAQLLIATVRRVLNDDPASPNPWLLETRSPARQ
ncbi:MAG TPA: PAS domain S-box protein [Bryobacterales bacterium]|nr:PAS domain S-box protein [Bryobacterales bacterium]